MERPAEGLVGGGRRAHERMTPDQFIWWLRGYLDSLGGETAEMPRADAKVIRGVMERVGPPPAPTPAPPIPMPSLDSLRRAFESAGKQDRATPYRCWRCQRVLPAGEAHFCNGSVLGHDC